MRYLTSSIAGAIVAGALSLGPLSLPAHGQDKIDDCEKIQAADAYNQCLAKFGPESKVRSVEPERPGDIKANSAEAAATAGPVKARGRRFGRHRGGRGSRVGRKRMSIGVGR